MRCAAILRETVLCVVLKLVQSRGYDPQSSFCCFGCRLFPFLVLSLVVYTTCREVYVDELADELSYRQVMRKACRSLVQATSSGESTPNAQVTPRPPTSRLFAVGASDARLACENCSCSVQAF